MNVGDARRKRSILVSLMLIIVVVVVATSVLFTALLVHYRTKDLVAEADGKLLTAAEFAREILGPDFHDGINNEASVSKEQFHHIVARNDDLCRRLNLQYLWSVLRVDNRLVFTSATHSNLADPNSPCASFFETHRDPGSFAAALPPDGTTSFSSFKNEWGQGRQVLVPRKDARGRTYIFGASVQLTELKGLVRRSILTSLGIGLSIIAGALLLAMALARSFTAPIARLTEAAERMATGDLDVSLASSGSRELQSLSDSLDQMRQGLKQHLAEVQESEEMFRSITESAFDMIALLDLKGCYLYCNAAYFDTLGYSPKDMIGRSAFTLCHPDERDHAVYTFQEWLTAKRARIQASLRLVCEDGSYRWVEHRATVLADEKGNPQKILIIAQDITERKQAEEALLKSKQQYDALAARIPIGVYLLRTTPNDRLAFDYVSPRMAEILGSTVEYIFGDPQVVFQAIHPEEVETFVALNHERIHTREPFLWEGRAVVNATIKWLRIESRPEPLDNGDVLWHGIIADITEGKQAEEALKEREKTLQAFFDAVHESLVLIDTEGKVLLSNTVGAQRLGKTVPEFVGTSLYDHFPPDVARYRKEQYHKVIAQREPVYFQDTRSGRSFEHYCYPVFDEDGNVSGVTIFAHEITERKRSMEALEESEGRYRTVVEHSRDGIAIIEEGIHIYVNKEFLNIFGFHGPEDVLGRTHSVTVHPDDLERVIGLNNTRQNGDSAPSTYEFKGLKNDGTIILIDVSATRIMHKGKHVILAFLRDITSRRHAEEQIRTSLREKEILLREVHHRVKNNMQVISSLLHLQSRYVTDTKVLDIFMESMDRIRSMALVHNKLYQSESLSRIDVCEYLRDLSHGLLSTYSVDTHVKLNIEIDPCSISIDTALPLGLIVNELLTNSLKHAFPGERTGRIDIRLEAKDEQLILAVSDNGIGLSEGLDYTKTESLGMQLVVTLAEQLEGTLRLEREQGTKFVLEFDV